MSLAAAISYARDHQPAVRVALARIAAQTQAAQIPRGLWLPSVGATAQLFAATANNTTGTYVTEHFLDIPRIGGTTTVSSGDWQPHAASLVGIGGTQELFDFGRIAALSAAADAQVDIAKENSRADLLEVTYDVEEAYFAVFAAKEILRASRDSYERSRAHRDLASAGVASGLRSRIELTRAEADLAKFDAGRLRAEGGVVTAQQVFAAAVAVPDERLDIAAAPPTPADLPPLTRAIEQASHQDPNILAALAALQAEEARTRAIAAELHPNLSATATLTGRAGGATPSGNGTLPNGNGFIPSVPNWDVGVVLSWPLFDGTVRAREATSRATEQIRREQVELMRERAVAAIRQSYVAVDVARSSLPALERAVEAARANSAQADARFRSGLGTSVELADAESLRTDAEIQLALGQFALARARAAFGRAVAEGI
jgi:outer membrane protein TolC